MELTNNFFYAKEYHKLWERTQVDLKRLIYAEDALQKEGDIEEWEKEYKILGGFYLQYIKAINKLDECYDHIVHPQKRILIKKLLDACLCRFLEVKHRMVELNLDDINLLDRMCVGEKMLPHDAEINIPRYFTREKKHERKQRKNEFENILKNLGLSETVTEENPMTVNRAILIIQTHERTRQALRSYDHWHTVMKLRELGKYPSFCHDDGSKLTNAATIIQKVWRGYKCRKSLWERKYASLMLIGMAPPLEYQYLAQKRNNEIRILRHQIQRQHEARFRQAIPGDRVRQMLRKRRKMHTLFRNRVRAWYNKNVILRRRRSFVFGPEDPPAVVTIDQKLKSPRFKPKRPKVQPVKKKKKKKKKKGKNDEEVEQKVKKPDPGPLERSQLRKQLIWEAQEFKRIWQDKNESANFHQIHDLHPITKENYRRMKQEVRKVVDDLMLLELKRLQEAVKAYHASKRKKKKKKKGGKKGKKKKGGKKGRKKKKKGEVDITADRTFESLFEELISKGIIKKYPEVPISSFTGDISFFAQQIEGMGKKPMPALGDVRKLIKEYCIIPLGSSLIHEHAPFVKSLMIAGPNGTGKHKLLHAICTELGAYLFDISNENIVNTYPDKSSLAMLVHLVNKVSRLLQPSIIFFDNAEKTFIKKIPKTDTSDPRRLKRVLPKFVKGIKANDRIMLIGISSRPFDAKQKGLNSVYKKFIYIPRPDFAALSKLWNDTLYQYKALNTQFDCCTMAKMCDGFSIASVLKIIKEVLTCKRLLTIKYQPLQPKEFFKHLCTEPPIYKEQEAAFIKWFTKCPLGKKKEKYLKSLEEAENAKKKGKK